MSKAQRLVAGLAGTILTVALTACGGGGGSVVTVNGQQISHADFDSKLEANPAARGVLQQMVTDSLIDGYAKDHNLTVSDDEINKLEDTYKKQFPNGQFDELLKARGMTEDDVKNVLKRQIILDKAVGGDIKISDKQVQEYFNKNKAAFDTPDQARARHILVPDLKTAQKVEADLKGGKDFAAEAKEFSQDPGSKDKGGELGFFRRGQMVPPFEKYAFSAPINQISPPIKSPFGDHVIQVEERKMGEKGSLAKAHDQIVQQLRQQQEAPLIQPFLMQLQQKANIQVNDPKFQSVFPSPAAAPSAAPTK